MNINVANQKYISHIEAQILTSRGWSGFTIIPKVIADSANYHETFNITQYLKEVPIGGSFKISYRIFDWRDKSMVVTKPEVLVKR